MLDFNKAQQQANKLHANAKDGTLKLNGDTYSFEFNRAQGHYIVRDSGDNVVMNLNTRKLTVARQWLKEHFAN